VSFAAADYSHDLPRLEKYELYEEIGHGGMATVYRGRDKRLGREVAVKIIHRHLRDNAEVATRFLAEARAAASLKHRGIVEVYDVSSEEDREKYLVAELVRGVTLRKFLVDDRELPAEIGAAIVLEVCDAIQHAHESGIVHRDVKPENVLIELPNHREAARGPVSGESGAVSDAPSSKADSGRKSDPSRRDSNGSNDATKAPSSKKDRKVVVKITDFGIAKVLDAQGVTSTGQVLGSPAHMAPEQIEGGDIDVRTDVFAIGVLFYEAVVGHLPFEGKNPAQVLRRVIEGEYAKVDVERADVGSRWARIIHSALELLQVDRTATPAVLGEQIRDELRALGIPDPHAEVCTYVADPDAYRAERAPQLAQRLLLRGEKGKRSGDVIGSAADFNRALALAPQDPEVQRRVMEMSRGRDRRALIRRASLVLGGSLVLGLVAFAGVRIARELKLPQPLPTEASQEIAAESDLDDGAIDLEDFPPEEDGTPGPASSSSTKPPRKNYAIPPVRLTDVPERAVKFAPNPLAAKLSVNGNAIASPLTAQLMLKPGRHTAIISPNDPCCEETNRTFIVHKAEAGSESEVETISLSAKFRPATVSIVGAPSGGTIVCGLATFSASPIDIDMKRATWSGTCGVIAGDLPRRNMTVTINAGRTQTIAWP